MLNKRVVGDRHLKMQLEIDDMNTGTNSKRIDAIAFNTTDNDWPPDVEQVHIAYRLDINEYRGLRSIQLIVEYAAPVAV